MENTRMRRVVTTRRIRVLHIRLQYLADMIAVRDFICNFSPSTLLPETQLMYIMTPPDLIRYVSDGFETAKAGQAAEIYSVVSRYFDQGLLERRSHYAFGWIIYYALHQADAHDIDNRKRMLARYLNLEVARPHKLHSMILTEAIRLHKDAADNAYLIRSRKAPAPVNGKAPTFSIVRFANLWNLAHLREGDWRRKEKDGKPLNSTVERLITSYVNELQASRQTPPPEFLSLIENARIAYPDSSNLLSQIAITDDLMGNTEEATDSLRNAILISPAKFFLWSRLASMIDKDKEPKLYMSLLYKALSLPGQEDYKGRIRLSLAEAWMSLKAYPQALYELEAIKSLYGRNGWHLPPRFTEMENAIPPSARPVDPLPAYRRIASLADDFIYSSLPETAVTKNYHKESSVNHDRYGNTRRQPAAWRVADGNGNNYWLTPSRFNIPDNLPVGTPLTVRLHNRKVVDAKIKN